MNYSSPFVVDEKIGPFKRRRSCMPLGKEGMRVGYYPICRGLVKIQYEGSDGLIRYLRDDGAGNLRGKCEELDCGGRNLIDYETGSVRLRFRRGKIPKVKPFMISYRYRCSRRGG